MQIKTAKEIIDRFYFQKRFKLYLCVLLSLIASLFEYFGLILIFQFIVVISNPDSAYVVAITDFFKNNFHIENFSLISLTLGILIALIYIFKNIYMYFFTIVNSAVLQDVSVNILHKTAKNILFGEFVKVNSVANEIKQSAFSKADIVVWNYLVQYINFITNIAIIVMLLLFLFVKFTLPALISSLFIAVLSFFEYKILKRKASYQNKFFGLYFDSLIKHLYKIINATKEIRLNNKSALFLSQAEEKFKNMAQINKKTAINSVFHIYFTEISIMVTFIVVLAVLFFTTDFSNKTIIMTLGAIIAAILRITPAVNRAQSSLYGINANEKIAQDLLEFDKQFETTEKEAETDEILPFENEIILENVSYKYPNSKFGLKNISFTIKKGEFIGIVGASGCYKTTLSLIIAGLIKAEKGRVLIDGTVLDNGNYCKWRNNIAILSQDFSILKDDVFEGLNKDIIKKLELKKLNHNPMELSFGQKQRVALADIIVKNKKLLILDEATSSLDVLSEEKINDILLELKGKKTIISIAHRLQILKHCDRVIFMDKGKIIDIDTFANLNDKYDEFKKIIKLSDFKLS